MKMIKSKILLLPYQMQFIGFYIKKKEKHFKKTPVNIKVLNLKVKSTILKNKKIFI